MKILIMNFCCCCCCTAGVAVLFQCGYEYLACFSLGERERDSTKYKCYQTSASMIIETEWFDFKLNFLADRN